MVWDHPLGAGPESFKQLARFYMPQEILTFHPGMEYGIRAAHNSLLQVLVEQGFLGEIIFIAMCGHTLFMLRGTFMKAAPILKLEPFWAMTLFGITYSFLSILIGGMFNSRIYYEFFWWQLALAVTTSYWIGKKVEEAAPRDESAGVIGK
jgi:O-antigen ligase